MKVAHTDPHNPRRNQSDGIQGNSKRSASGQKSNYIGLTLKEYLNLKDPTEPMEQIEEQSSQSQATNSPTFKNTHIGFSNSKNANASDKEKLRSRHKQELLSLVNNILHQPQTKIPKINLQDFTPFQKQTQKLPAIHQQRTVKSRNTMNKDQNHEGKRQRSHTLKTEQIQIVSDANFTLRKQVQKGKAIDISKYSMQMKKSVRPRVVSTTFYNMHFKQKERARIKTEDAVVDKHLQHSFMITKYKESALNRKKVEETQNIFKKH